MLLKEEETLTSILDKGINGNLTNMSVEDWKLLEYLIDENGRTQYTTGVREGYKKGYRSGKWDSKMEYGIVL